VVALIVGNKLYCANVGDARGIMCRDGKALDLSVDHKAKRKDEQDRIKADGGYIVYGRVLGRLAISRAFGDFDCKNIEMPARNLDGTENTETDQRVIRSFVLSEPEIRVVDLDPKRDDFFLLASDGLFDRFSSEECVKLVREKLSKMDIMEQSCQ
jgi:serine/threonine protein phosphatase PrpC